MTSVKMIAHPINRRKGILMQTVRNLSPLFCEMNNLAGHFFTAK
jgi:hypothetical protein